MHQYDGLEDKVLYSRTCIVNSHNNDTLCKVIHSDEYHQSLQVFSQLSCCKISNTLTHIPNGSHPCYKFALCEVNSSQWILPICINMIGLRIRSYIAGHALSIATVMIPFAMSMNIANPSKFFSQLSCCKISNTLTHIANGSHPCHKFALCKVNSFWQISPIPPIFFMIILL